MLCRVPPRTSRQVKVTVFDGVREARLDHVFSIAKDAPTSLCAVSLLLPNIQMWPKALF